jgi:NDP-sugar pyrophosphorylase family protein
MKAVLLAGGKGTRLAPYTTILPKPLMPVGDMPILEIVIRQLVRCGFDDITLAVGHLAELIMAYFSDGKKFDVKLSYSREPVALGTAGPISLVPELRETFLVMNGDLLTSLDFAEMWRYHRQRGAIGTLAIFPRDEKIDFGVIEADAEGWVRTYIEKPIYHYSVSTGIYIFEPAVLKYIPKGTRLDLPDLVLTLLRQGEKVSAFSYAGHWLDIGRKDDYESALRLYESNPKAFFPGT